MPEALDDLEERILRRIPREVLGTSVLMGLGAAVLFGLLPALFVLAGGLVSAAGFFWMKKGLARILQKKKRKALGVGLAFLGLRLVLILLIFFTIIWAYSKGLLAFAAGFSAVIPVFLMEAVGALSRARQWKD